MFRGVGEPRRISRAGFFRLAVGGLLAPFPGTGALAQEKMRTRSIPSSGEALPVVGLGTWRTFDVGTSVQERSPLRQVLSILFEAGGSVIDSSPMYGAAEGVVGDLLSAMKAHDRAFIATKVWTSGRQAGIDQMRKSMQLLKDERIELMQIHNLVDWKTHLATLRGWKQEGRIRYLGITHYTESAHADLEAIMRAETIDFVQLDYAMDDRSAEKRLLLLAADRGIAVIVNQPFGGGGLIRSLVRRPLPDWAGEIEAASWAQILLKFCLGHPAVTCVIPGTSRPDHMRDNARAGFGRLPDPKMRERMAAAL
ncbi:MAG: aldo/keto reductase [Alphaproteobacteria bacterium]|nr:aldo/keto reductase [Alphaproteobacteria bacterium]